MSRSLWTYLFVYSEDFPVEKLKKWVDEHPHIVNWYRTLPNSYIIVSDWTAKGLAAAIREEFAGKRFLLLDTETDRDGWLPKMAWSFMHKPRQAGEEG